MKTVCFAIAEPLTESLDTVQFRSAASIARGGPSWRERERHVRSPRFMSPQIEPALRDADSLRNKWFVIAASRQMYGDDDGHDAKRLRSGIRAHARTVSPVHGHRALEAFGAFGVEAELPPVPLRRVRLG